MRHYVKDGVLYVNPQDMETMQKVCLANEQRVDTTILALTAIGFTREEALAFDYPLSVKVVF